MMDLESTTSLPHRLRHCSREIAVAAAVTIAAVAFLLSAVWQSTSSGLPVAAVETPGKL